MDIDEGWRLLEAATPAPWHLSASWRQGGERDFGELPPGVSVAWQIQGGYPDDPGEGWALLHSEVPKGTIEPEDADLDLIVWLRNSAPSLLSELSSLRGEVERLRAALQACERYADNGTDWMEKIRATSLAALSPSAGNGGNG